MNRQDANMADDVEAQKKINVVDPEIDRYVAKTYIVQSDRQSVKGKFQCLLLWEWETKEVLQVCLLEALGLNINKSEKTVHKGGGGGLSE